MEEEKKNTLEATEITPESAQTSPADLSQASTIPKEEAIVGSSALPEAAEQAVVAEVASQAESAQPDNAPNKVSGETPNESLPENSNSETEVAEVPENSNPTGVEIAAEPEKSEKTAPSLQDQPNDFRRIAWIIAAVAILIFFAWLINRESTKDNSSDSDVNITVDGEQQDGTVNIIDEVKGDIRIEDSSVTATRPLAGYVITAYYLNAKSDPEMKNCGKVYSLQRQGERKYDSNIVNTVRGLLAPLSAEEQAQGFSSAIPANTFLQYVRLDGKGNMEANFSGQISKAAGSCAVTAIRAQITQTLMQFANVKTVTICINGNCKQDEVLQP